MTGPATSGNVPASGVGYFGSAACCRRRPEAWELWAALFQGGRPLRVVARARRRGASLILARPAPAVSARLGLAEGRRAGAAADRRAGARVRAGLPARSGRFRDHVALPPVTDRINAYTPVASAGQVPGASVRGHDAAARDRDRAGVRGADDPDGEAVAAGGDLRLGQGHRPRPGMRQRAAAREDGASVAGALHRDEVEAGGAAAEPNGRRRGRGDAVRERELGLVGDRRGGGGGDGAGARSRASGSAPGWAGVGLGVGRAGVPEPGGAPARGRLGRLNGGRERREARLGRAVGVVEARLLAGLARRRRAGRGAARRPSACRRPRSAPRRTRRPGPAPRARSSRPTGEEYAPSSTAGISDSNSMSSIRSGSEEPKHRRRAPSISFERSASVQRFFPAAGAGVKASSSITGPARPLAVERGRHGREGRLRRAAAVERARDAHRRRRRLDRVVDRSECRLVRGRLGRRARGRGRRSGRAAPAPALRPTPRRRRGPRSRRRERRRR